MPVRQMTLTSPVVLVPSRDLPSKLRDFVGREGFPTSPYDIEKDLNALRASGGVPLTISAPMSAGKDPSVLVHTSGYVIRLFPARRRDAYVIAGVSPVRLRDHQRLATGPYLALGAPSWHVVLSLRQVPPGSSSGWDEIEAGWRALAARGTGPGPEGPDAPTETGDGSYGAFLDALEAVIDAGERLDAARSGRGSYPYRQVRPAGGIRHRATQVYEFVLSSTRVPAEKTYVQLATTAADGDRTVRVRGQVTGVDAQSVTIRFEELVDFDDLRGQGEITESTMAVVFQAQRDAARKVRDGQAANPAILTALVDGEIDAPPLATGPEPAAPLSLRQRAAYDKALAGGGLLVVIGPPGTGKTRTITEITRTAARDGRVLISSKNNRAVDNVLARLPEDLLAIRVGNAGGVTAEGEPYLLARWVADLKQEVTGRTNARLTGYARLGDAAGWTAELSRANRARAEAAVALTRAEAALEQARLSAGGPLTAELGRLARTRADAERDMARSTDRASHLRDQADAAAARAGLPAIGWAFAIRARRKTGKAATERIHADSRAAAVRNTEDALAVTRLRLAEVTRDDPAVAAVQATADAAAEQVRAERAAALAAFRCAADAVAGTGDEPPPVREDEDRTGRDEDLAAAENWLAGQLPLLAARRDLLTEWAGAAQEASADDLGPELLRYADVLAATCTGAGSRPELADLDFELAIVDEAGQIGAADAIIPLTRARRGVLVGDHRQLPPFTENDLREWGETIEDPAVFDILAKSALELITEKLPAASPSIVWLTEQRRMPEVIAEFISGQFYDGQLSTPAGLRDHRDELFGSPLAAIDTAGACPERRGQQSEQWGAPGIANDGEADLLADLAAHYHRTHQDWAVIVPYKAQARLIQRLLAGRAGDTATIGLNVGTVDSFQGGERDVIAYGFTRSNRGGTVGFLSELRRLNVALTRSRSQLVLAGDFTTLANAKDDGFRAFARALRDYAAGRGEILSRDEARARLRAAGSEGAR